MMACVHVSYGGMRVCVSIAGVAAWRRCVAISVILT
jgi:hypothetical protein